MIDKASFMLNFNLVPDINTHILDTQRATVAQVVEQLIRNQQASGSSPLGGSIKVRERGQTLF